VTHTRLKLRFKSGPRQYIRVRSLKKTENLNLNLRYIYESGKLSGIETIFGFIRRVKKEILKLVINEVRPVTRGGLALIRKKKWDWSIKGDAPPLQIGKKGFWGTPEKPCKEGGS